ncbi:hypothetical protein MPL3365_220004 [Mesorhizobium plurifarium]|uniref:Uncharacterized protein n=1 Tax=Mesorhizobium plurifarium TaxID=69974 RepID=A0A090G476_MESPL|nr:hypothetical protein MPL3365_220004 [Mesorhizobium plurifarium]
MAGLISLASAGPEATKGATSSAHVRLRRAGRTHCHSSVNRGSLTQAKAEKERETDRVGRNIGGSVAGL